MAQKKTPPSVDHLMARIVAIENGVPPAAARRIVANIRSEVEAENPWPRSAPPARTMKTEGQ